MGSNQVCLWLDWAHELRVLMPSGVVMGRGRGEAGWLEVGGAGGCCEMGGCLAGWASWMVG